MKLYMHPASTTCRPIMLFVADSGLDLEQQVVDLFTGEQYGPAFTAINPNNCVPVLADGDFRLTESSAILKYLADVCGSAAYPTDLRQRARVNELMDWFNTGFYRTFGYGLCYAQLLEPYRLSNPEGQAEAVAAAKKSAERLLGILNDHILGSRPYLCGNAITIADYFASGIVSLGDVIGCTFAAWPNVVRWIDTMRGRPNWQNANAGLRAWADLARGPHYVTV